MEFTQNDTSFCFEKNSVYFTLLIAVKMKWSFVLKVVRVKQAIKKH